MTILEPRQIGVHGRGVNLVIVSIIFVTIAFCLVGARVGSRLSTGRKLGPDDYAIIASVVSKHQFIEAISLCFDAAPKDSFLRQIYRPFQLRSPFAIVSVSRLSLTSPLPSLTGFRS